MKKRKEVQVIKKGNIPEWAVIPYKDYTYLRELEEIASELAHFKKALSRNEEEFIPSEYVQRLIKGENPVRVWREYRHMTQAALAKKVEISVPYLSQIENNERTPSVSILKKLAKALNLSIEDIA